MRQQKSVPLTGAVAVGAIFMAVVCVATAALLIAARHAPEATAQPLEIGAVPPSANTIPDNTVPANKAQASKVPAVKPQAQKSAPATKPAPPATAATPSALPAKALVADTTAARPVAARPGVPQPELVAITGCLERNDADFRLKNTEGVDVPKARSWKSGFLKKRSAPIDLVDATRGLELMNHIGQRVRLTGMLADREMRVRSLERVSMSCN